MKWYRRLFYASSDMYGKKNDIWYYKKGPPRFHTPLSSTHEFQTILLFSPKISQFHTKRFFEWLFFGVKLRGCVELRGFWCGTEGFSGLKRCGLCVELMCWTEGYSIKNDALLEMVRICTQEPLIWPSNFFHSYPKLASKQFQDEKPKIKFFDRFESLARKNLKRLNYVLIRNRFW